jgi:hypothetical protein
LEAITAGLLFLILRGRGSRLDFLAPALYLFSFTISATSDFLTGLQLTNLMMVLAIFSYEKKWLIPSGLFWCLACLTKLYAAPALLGFVIFLYYRQSLSELKKIIYGILIGLALIVLPYLMIAPDEFIQYIITHQFNRPDGLNQLNVWSFFLKKEWLILIISLISAYFLRKSYFVFSLALSLVFLLVFKDIYYLYLGVTMPYLIILVLGSLGEFWKMGGVGKNLTTFGLTLIFIFSLNNFIDYARNFSTSGRFENLTALADYFKNTNDSLTVYGSHEVAPLVALASNRQIFNNIIDSNSQSFGSGAQDLKSTSEGLVKNGGYLISRITHYPELNLFNRGYEGYFSQEIFEKYCQRIKEFEDTGRNQSNQIVIYRCKK